MSYQHPTPLKSAIPFSVHQANDYQVQPEQISEAARTTILALLQAGFHAFIVGGGVRDTLLGLHPKDFDIATNATPDQVKRIFGRQCHIIGRRFLLAHVYQGRHMVEVATFRAPHGEGSSQGETSAHGMILRDNVWGRIDQDALRRDFTVNALYYQPFTGEIHDFAGGMADIRRRQLRMIGDAATRYREDPVRMLRVARFAAKLEFNIEAATAAPIPQLAYLLAGISPHRLFDECLKLFGCGKLSTLLPAMHKLGVLKQLLPHMRDQNELPGLVTRAAANTDARLAAGKTINPAFFFAVLLWENQQNEARRLLSQGEAILPAYQQAATQAIIEQTRRTAIPKFVGQTIREIWEMQPRLQKPRGRTAPALLASPRFRAAFDFLLLREQNGDTQTNGMAAWWEDYQAADDDTREVMLRELDKPVKKKPAKKKKTTDTTPEQPAGEESEDA